MPNIFTPNGDEFNSNFVPIEMNGIKSGNLIVYNRWGQQLFQTTDLKTGWDGRGQDTHPGVYFWELKYIDIGNSSRTLKGTVMLSK
jgi:gliding motility-associated-like protein